jgi:hypothetical protein
VGSTDRRARDRVEFERGIDVYLVAISVSFGLQKFGADAHEPACTVHMTVISDSYLRFPHAEYDCINALNPPRCRRASRQIA